MTGPCTAEGHCTGERPLPLGAEPWCVVPAAASSLRSRLSHLFLRWWSFFDVAFASVSQAVEFLRRKYSTTDRPIFNKKLEGVLRRFASLIPSTGPESANQRIRKCSTLEGSKPGRQFTDVGEYGMFQIRRRSCHIPCCIALDTANCVVKDNCGEAQFVTSNPLSEPKLHFGQNAHSMTRRINAGHVC